MITNISSYFPDNCPMTVRRMKEQNEMELHEHEFHELVIVFSGTGVHYTDDEEYAISIGDVLLVTSGHAHGYRETHKLDLINLLYLPAQIQIPQQR